MSKLTVTRVNKSNSKYFVKDGIIKYIVSFDPKVTCQCSHLLLCNHIMYLLEYEFLLSNFTIRYLHYVYDDFLKNINNISGRDCLNDLLESKILDKFNNEDCGFCLSKLSDPKYKYEIYECSKCHNLTHQKCMTIWKKGCIICRPYVTN
jgi:hypothetical protein